MFGEKLTFGGANPQTELFWWDVSLWILDGSANCDVLKMRFSQFHQVWWRLSTQERITHVSSLKTSTKKSDKLKRHEFPTKRRKLFWLFSMHIWTLTCYISAHVLEGVWISKKCTKCNWPGKNIAKQLKRKFLAETAEILKRQEFL
jgi:hypothetical protein